MKDLVKLLFFGDTYIDNNKVSILEDGLKEKLQDYDVVCCNFEAPVKSELQTAAKEPGVKLSQSYKIAQNLIEEGFNLFALANNHIMNYGVNGLKHTLDYFKKLEGVSVIGAGLTYEEAYSPFIFEKAGIKIGIVNAAEHQYGTIEQNSGQGGHAWIFSEYLFSSILSLKVKCDRIILICHAGLENAELPLPEWRRAYKNFVDMGVDVVIGHHPHVVQGWEAYNGGLIFYSLGNFVWSSTWVKSSQNPAIAVSLVMDRENVKYEIIQIRNLNGSITLIKENAFSEYLDEICNLLYNQNKYEQRINEICLQEYRNVYAEKVYELVHLSGGRKLKHYIWNLYKIVFKKNDVDNKLLYLWCVDETLRWVIARALIYNKGKEDKEINSE